MPSESACSLENLSNMDIKRELSRSKASTIYEIRLCGKPCVMKLVSSFTTSGNDADLLVSRERRPWIHKKTAEISIVFAAN
jgi:hypothetical protein